MTRMLDKGISRVDSLPKFVRFVLGPLVWRAGIVGATFTLLHHFPQLVIYDLYGRNALAELSPMFYSVAGVLGVLAGFLVAALTILGTANSPSTASMRQRAATSMPLKLLYSIATLLVASIAISLAGPYADRIFSFAILCGGLLVAAGEMVAVSLLVFMALVPSGSRGAKTAYVIDP